MVAWLKTLSDVANREGRVHRKILEACLLACVETLGLDESRI